MNRAGLTAVLICMLIGAGCASKKYVRKEQEATNRRVDAVEQSVEANETRIRQNEGAIAANREESAKTKQEVGLVRTEAAEAKRLAQGKLLYQVVLNNDAIRFASDQAELTDTGTQILEQLVARLKAENRNVYIEIEGHTDSTGEESYNDELGLMRAEAVRRYLVAAGIPLHRVGVISYGETRPIADNSTAEGRTLNRRIVLMVRE